MKTKLLIFSALLLTSCENITVEQVQTVGEFAHETWHIVNGTDCIFKPEIVILTEDCGK